MKSILYTWVGLLSYLAATCLADDGGQNNNYYNQNQYNYNQNGNGADDGMEGYNNNYMDAYGDDGSEYIKYWTDYQILPKRCIVYNDVDNIVFQVFNGQDHCTSKPIGTYVAPVPSYMNGHLQERAQKMADRGYDDDAIVNPSVAQYLECTQYAIQGTYYYLQLGCADDTTQSLAVNIYEDNQCTVRSAPEGYDDATIDVSELEVCCTITVSRMTKALDVVCTFERVAHLALTLTLYLLSFQR